MYLFCGFICLIRKIDSLEMYAGEVALYCNGINPSSNADSLRCGCKNNKHRRPKIASRCRNRANLNRVLQQKFHCLMKHVTVSHGKAVVRRFLIVFAISKECRFFENSSCCLLRSTALLLLCAPSALYTVLQNSRHTNCFATT